MMKDKFLILRNSSYRDGARNFISRKQENGEVANVEFKLGAWGVPQAVTSNPDVARAFALRHDGRPTRAFSVFNLNDENDKTALEKRPVEVSLLQTPTTELALALVGIRSHAFLTALCETEKNNKTPRPEVVSLLESRAETVSLAARLAKLEQQVENLAKGSTTTPTAPDNDTENADKHEKHKAKRGGKKKK